MDAPESIIDNAEYHARLLSTIAGLEYVPQAMKDQIEYVKDLERQIEPGKTRISELAAKTKKIIPSILRLLQLFWAFLHFCLDSHLV